MTEHFYIEPSRDGILANASESGNQKVVRAPNSVGSHTSPRHFRSSPLSGIEANEPFNPDTTLSPPKFVSPPPEHVFESPPSGGFSRVTDTSHAVVNFELQTQDLHHSEAFYTTLSSLAKSGPVALNSHGKLPYPIDSRIQYTLLPSRRGSANNSAQSQRRRGSIQPATRSFSRAGKTLTSLPPRRDGIQSPSSIASSNRRSSAHTYRSARRSTTYSSSTTNSGSASATSRRGSAHSSTHRAAAFSRDATVHAAMLNSSPATSLFPSEQL